ncbi:hypothetical protein [Endozoicomonas atrinae]|uniref:hypothetical protein n=1 Tax=Endozoicomonas atrinae TaxID=1333660 RepID=UPI00082591AF|nr:hypothetical protein [Endozoicomonas atrinae]
MDSVVPTLHSSLVEQKDELQGKSTREGKFSRFTVSVSEESYRALNVLTCHNRCSKKHNAHEVLQTVIQERDFDISEQLTDRYFAERSYARAEEIEWPRYIERYEFKISNDESQLLRSILNASRNKLEMRRKYDYSECSAYLDGFIDGIHHYYSENTPCATFRFA